jgi:hypothetical protein
LNGFDKDWNKFGVTKAEFGSKWFINTGTGDVYNVGHRDPFNRSTKGFFGFNADSKRCG